MYNRARVSCRVSQQLLEVVLGRELSTEVSSLRPQHSPERTSLDKLPNELTIRGRVAQMRYSGSAEPMSAEFWTLQRKTSKYFCFCNSHIPEVVYSVPRVIAHVTPSVFATPTTQNYKHP